jgi:hypothetical protein
LQRYRDHIPSPFIVRHYVLFVAIGFLHFFGVEIKAQDVKCGTPATMEKYRERTKSKLPLATEPPPVLSDSIISPAGRFTIHFDKEGSNATPIGFANNIALLADEAYEFEVITLGYINPPYTFADSSWHIYLVPLGSTIYGKTVPIVETPISTTPSGLEMYRSFMVISNNFDKLPTKGDDAARITVFHEFHHVIQFGSYGLCLTSNIQDKNIHEMSSVWIEMRSAPEIKDYLNYISSYLQKVEERFDKADGFGYGQGIWMQYLQLRFGDDVIKGVWETLRNVSPSMLTIFDTTLYQYNSTFCNEYKRFGAEIFFTGRRFRGTSIFPDAQRIPVEYLKYHIQDTGKTYTHDLLNNASLNLYSAGINNDSCVVSVSRSPDFIFSSDTITIFDLNSYRATYQIPETFCDTIVGGKETNAEAFPMPFVISSDKNETVKLFAKSGSKPASDTRLGIYTVDMKLVRYIEGAAMPISGRYYMEWDGRDDIGKYVSSGVYIYSIEVDSERRQGKLVVVRK